MDVSFVDTLLYYFGSWFWVLLCLASLVCLFVRQDMSAKRKMFLWAGFSIVFMYNRFSMYVITRVVEKATYYRFLWLIPGALVIAGALYALLGSLRNRMVAAVLFIAFFVLLWRTQSSFFTLESSHKPANIYELEEDIFGLEEIISADKDEKSPRVAMPSLVQMEYRTYDASVQNAIRKEVYQTMGDHGYICRSKNRRRQEEYRLGALLDGKRMDQKDRIRGALEYLHTDYVVSQRNPEAIQVLEATGLQSVGETGAYVVYRFPNHKEKKPGTVQ